MKVDILNSGSSGNCVVIDDTIIIDAGWNAHLQGECVFLTHAHADHTKYLGNMEGLPIYALSATADKIHEKNPYLALSDLPTSGYISVSGGAYGLVAWPVKHDAPCVGYEVYKQGVEPEVIFYATDFVELSNEGAFIAKLADRFYDAIYIEGNNTLSITDMQEIYMYDEEVGKPKDEFHRRRSYQNHCSIDYLISLFERAGFSKENPFTEPVTLLHKSSTYYLQHIERIAYLCEICNITNPLL